jgi:hypothetical protein
MPAAHRIPYALASSAILIASACDLKDPATPIDPTGTLDASTLEQVPPRLG